MAECMIFPEKWEQFMRDYEWEESRRIYTNGSMVIQSFRVKQMMEHYLPQAKAEAIKEFAERLKKHKYESSDWSHGEHPFVVEESDIDEVLYEMTEGNGNA